MASRDQQPKSGQEELPAHYFQYKGNFKRCAAIQEVFVFFEVKQLIQMQQLSRRFYSYIGPSICPKVPLRKNLSYTQLMREQTTRVMIFYKQPNFYTLSPLSQYKWKSAPLSVEGSSAAESEAVLSSCPVEWPKNCQISPTEWLFFGGGINDENDQIGSEQQGSNAVLKLNTRQRRLTKLADMPCATLAHQVIYLPATARAPQGTVYVFGGLLGSFQYQDENYKLDLASQTWTQLPNWKPHYTRLSFNLLPLLQNRFILVVSEVMPVLFDTQTDKFVKIKQTGHRLLEGVQIGAFTLPIGTAIPQKKKCWEPQNSDNLCDLFNESADSFTDSLSYGSYDHDEIDHTHQHDLDLDRNAEVGGDSAMVDDSAEAQSTKGSKTLIEMQAAEEVIDMVWFGSIGDYLSDRVFHARLTLTFEPRDDQERVKVKKGALNIKLLRNSQGLFASLKMRDRFFYNQEFFMREPTERMSQLGHGYRGKYTMKWFNKNRYIGVIGREAFHVFDLQSMDFIDADPQRGYKTNIARSVYPIDDDISD